MGRWGGGGGRKKSARLPRESVAEKIRPTPPGERGRKNPPDSPNFGGVGNIYDGTRSARHPRKTFSEQVFPTPARPRTYFPDSPKMGGVRHISAGKEIARLPQAGWHVSSQPPGAEKMLELFPAIFQRLKNWSAATLQEDQLEASCIE